MKKSSVLILFVFSTLLVFSAFTFWAYHFLSVHHPIKSNNFLIESWVNAYDAEEAIKMIKKNGNPQVFIVGQNYERKNHHSLPKEKNFRDLKPIRLSANGAIQVFPDINENKTGIGSLTLKLVLKGSKARGVFSHVSVAINGVFLHSFFTSGKKEEYQLTIHPDTALQRISVCFDNDLYTREEDRNLFLYGISINDMPVEFTGQTVSFAKTFDTYNTGFSSSADHLAQYISDLGLDPSTLHSISFDARKRNQTLHGAFAFKEAIDINQMTSFNVISTGIHSRRSWKTYQKLFEGKADVGVYYFAPVGYKETNWYKQSWGYKQLFKEFVSYLANLFYSPD